MIENRSIYVRVTEKERGWPMATTGFWPVKVRTEEGRKQIAKSSYDKVVDVLVNFYTADKEDVVHTTESLKR